MADDDRIHSIEAHLAFQDRTLSELNKVVYKQQKQIDALAATCAMLTGKLSDMKETPDAPQLPNTERPPHY